VARQQGSAHSQRDELKEAAKAILEGSLDRLAKAQELLWMNDSHSFLLVLQAMDAAGKDGIIEHVFSGLNPQGCQVSSFKQPSAEDLDHNFLWRYSNRLPERGQIGIFNRSYYEEVLVVRVHPDILARQKLPSGKRGKSFWQARYDDINAFERHLVRNGTVIVKVFLHVSKGEQKRRLLARLDEPDKHWKFSAADVDERAYWNDYMAAFEEAITATASESAPWYVVPADSKPVARAIVATILASTIERLHLRPPKLTAVQRRALGTARAKLARE
jgi:PPK2 family polyphosphate:nucleotide phosphotransferase